MSRLRIFCDVDGVLADFVGLVLDYAQRNSGAIYARESVDQWDCFAAINMATHWPYFRRQCDELDLCQRMSVMLGAVELWAEIVRVDPDAKVCTTPMTEAWLSQRARWLVAFGVPLKQQIQMEGKEALAGEGRILIDDKPENCEAFTDAGGKAFCIATPYNTNVRNDVPRGTHAECLAWLRTLAAIEAL